MASASEGTLTFSSGAWVNGGWHVRLATSNSTAVTVTLTGTVALPVTCVSGGGSGGTISVPVSTTVTIPAGSTAYLPTSDQKSSLGWLGAVQAPVLCGSSSMRNTAGATFSGTVQSSAHTGQLTFQFQYPVSGPGVTLSSDHTMSGADVPGGQTAHGDFINAWNQATLQQRISNCLHTAIICMSNGEPPPQI